MISPGEAAQAFLWALLIGAVLGLIYGFLRPLRLKCCTLADGIFVIAAFLGWVQLCFGICACDCRPGYTLGLFLGGYLWEISFGRLLRPVFSLLWQVIFWPWKKIFEIFRKFYIFLLAILKKWVTIVGTIPKAGGAAHGKETPGQTGIQKNQSHHKSRHSGRRRPVRGGTGGAV